MKKSVLTPKKWVYLQTMEDFDRFLDTLDKEWEDRGGSKENTFTDWVNHYYSNLLKDLGPSNGQLFS